jgi:hypothetical protein
MEQKYDAPDVYGDETVMELLKKYPILRYFKYSHLPEGLRSYSKPYHEMAWTSAWYGKNIPECAAGLRKLLEAKDCFVRSMLPPE